MTISRVRVRPRRARAVVAAAAVVIMTGCANGKPDTAAGQGYVGAESMITFLEPDEREPAPDLLGELLGGGAYSLVDERGDDVVVVNVWGSWCAPCRAEADALQAVYEEVQGDGVQFLGINTRDTEDAALTFVADKGITYPSLVDDGALQAGFSRSLPVAAIPTTYVLDRSGRVAARVVDDISYAGLLELVERVLGEGPPAGTDQ